MTCPILRPSPGSALWKAAWTGLPVCTCGGEGMVKGQLFGGGQQAVDTWAGAFTLRSRWREAGRERNGPGWGPSTDAPSSAPFWDKPPPAHGEDMCVKQENRPCLTEQFAILVYKLLNVYIYGTWVSTALLSQVPQTSGVDAVLLTIPPSSHAVRTFGLI